MMPALVAPVAFALLGLAAGWFLPRLLAPKAATQVLTAAVLLTTAAVLAALVQVAVADAVGWCRALYAGQHGAAPVAGALAGVALALIAVGVARRWCKVRRELAGFSHVDGVEVVDLGGPVAFAVPGDPGGVVLGAGLLEHLDGPARRAVLAHENAHLALNHHRYVRAAELCAAGIPILRPLAVQVRFLTERWADEVAADAIGSRRVLAATIARVALMPSDSLAPSALRFGGQRTVARVDALLHPTSSPLAAAVAGGAVVVAAVGAGSFLQLHHLATFFAHICPV